MYLRELKLTFTERPARPPLFPDTPLGNPRDAAAILRSILEDEVVEVMGLLCLPTTPRIIGYRVANRIAVKVRALDRLGAMLDAVVAAGADRLDGVRFSIAEPERFADAARREAMADARRKAEIYATAAGVRVGRVLDIAEHGVRLPPPIRLQAAEMSVRAAVPIAPGEQRVSVTVTVVYEIE